MAVVLVPLLQLASLLFLARAILSWFRLGPDSTLYPVVRVLNRITEPVLSPIRRLLPRTGPIDFSVLVVLLAISFVLTPLATTL